MAGYSGTPLIKKLGFKPGDLIRTINEPNNYLDLLGFGVSDIDIKKFHNEEIELDAIHLFTTSLNELERSLPQMIAKIKRNGMIWISWPKKSSKVPSDLNENIIRDIALKTTIVDIKVVAIDEIWSGLKFVIRKENR